LITTGLAKKLGKLFIKNTRHRAVFAVTSVPDAEYFPFVEQKLRRTVLVFMNPLPPLNILLAEDERSVAFSISFALRSDGHRIEIVPDGEQALSKLIAEPGAFDLLITDNNMPRMTGLELVTRVRDTPFRGKILVLSAHLSGDNRAAYTALRVDGMMPKPFDLHQLRNVIREIAGDAVAIIPGEFQLSRTEVCKLLKLGLPESEELDELVGGS
jgi:two-component system chemotaxis response regulator CheY